ncbi:MAG: hypothetical protein U0165_13325 [Polyangiaceae bacterium]
MRRLLLLGALMLAACGGEVADPGTGASASAGTSGASGSSGTSGAAGGSSGANGTSGTSGAAGTNGCASPDPSQLQPPMCRTQSDCTEGVCDLSSPACVPSSCTCDEATGTWGCTDDCGLVGKCTPTSTCAGPNPQGCAQTGCSAGFVCMQLSGQCVSSSCSCDASTGSWVCDPDCNGGACVPDTGSKACGGLGGVICSPDEVCDWPDGSCGATDGQGVCVPRPTTCNEPCTGICGCDGAVYCNECEALAAGSDAAASPLCGE